MREFPYEFTNKKDVLFYPQKPDDFAVDVLEIGPGRGDLLLDLAGLHHNKKFIAIEYGKKRYFRLSKRIEKRLLTNILLICGDARLVVPQFFKESTCEQIYLLFSDPWPKDRHEFRRLPSLKFLWLLTHILKSGGSLVVATDHTPFAHWIQENLSQVAALTNDLQPLPFTSSLPELPQTFFEEKWRKLGKEIYFFKYTKK